MTARHRPDRSIGSLLAEASRRTLAPALRLWVTSLQSSLDRLPRPEDTPHAHAAGDDPDRILIFGAGHAVGWGVRSHDLALPGSLARALSALTGRGVDVDVVADPDLDVAGAARTIGGLPLWRYDAIVIVLGVNDALALTPVSEWRRGLLQTLGRILSATASSTRVLVAGTPRITSIPLFDSPIAKIADRQATTMNAATLDICAASDRTVFVPFTAQELPHASHAVYRHRTPAEYFGWAREIADALTRHPGGLRQNPPPRAVPPGPAIAEASRQRAVDRLPDLSGAPLDRLEELVSLAQRAFRSDSAVFTVLDRDRQRDIVQVGPFLEEAPRSSSFCDHTIRQTSGMVVRDALKDPRFRRNPLVLGAPNIRFYAGYPIESDTGERIGALCVFDKVPRPAEDIDLGLLRELAKLMQRELWAQR